MSTVLLGLRGTNQRPTKINKGACPCSFINKNRRSVKFGPLPVTYFRKRADINDGLTEGSEVEACMDW